MELSGDAYLWVKVGHIVSVISWMAGLLYLPRLFVYHTGAEPGSQSSETFKVMERRLYRAIMTPAMVASWVFGLMLAFEQGSWDAGWFHAKLMCLLGLMAFHLAMGRWRQAFAEDRNRHSEKFFRVVNEGPTVLMIAIVVFAVVKPY